MQKLYLVCYDDGGENCDLFVRTHSPDEALRMWQWHYGQFEKPDRVVVVPDAAGPVGPVEWADVDQYHIGG
jgi:hypothetical protein